ncbi:NAD(P)-dependent oxidoreductase [Candidatus Woesearchaeota archaeon]|nr:NAD(P)-dependent oxidoreductase [Candidatus Woesearchaeota archaeon]
MKRILVTGGFGFIGSHLINRLSGLGYKAACLEKTLPDKKLNNGANKLTGDKSSQAQVIKADLSTHDPSKGISKNFDYIIHLAGNVVTEDFINAPEMPFFNNINSTLNILEDIRLNNPSCILIFASTEKIYSNTNKKYVDEKTAIFPSDSYARSKMICELLIREYHANHGINYIIFRPANVFGHGQKPSLFIPSVMSQIAAGKKKIKVGNLSAYRNFIYVDDLIAAFVKCIEGKNKILNETYNLSSYNLQISGILGAIIALAKKNKIRDISVIQDRTLVRPLKYEPSRYVLNTAKASKLLNWKPKYRFEDALNNTFLHYLGSLNQN